jgi:hypothetical protein
MNVTAKAGTAEIFEPDAINGEPIIIDQAQPDDDAPEISFAASEEISRWRRIVHGSEPEDLCENMEQAVVALWQLVSIERTAHPESADVLEIHVADVLYNLAVSVGIGDGNNDEIQKFISRPKDPPPPRQSKQQRPARAADDAPRTSRRTVAANGVASAGEMQRTQDDVIRRRNGPAASTIAAMKYVIAQNDPQLLRNWLARRPPDERRALKAIMVAK